ncbi:MAG: ABC transporter substrate-binding protein [Desulfovibrio sp.]|jgi:iron(III) transport system substrate-binding protein|nr:ABC transporter substrate-binding protein [Desulfovibrio sp.]
MFRKLSALVIAACFLFSFAATAAAAEKLIIYTSMKESLIGELSEAFKKKNPGVDVDYQSAGAGKLMAKIAAERQSGKILADLIWTSEVPDFYNMKKEGLLEQYVSPVSSETLNPFGDFDGSFTAARLGTLGIAYNTRIIKKAPEQWSDIFNPEFKGAFGIANPSLSGTAYMSIALMVNKFGWEFIEKISANQGKIGKGSGQVVDDTASGELAGSLAVDYITNDKIRKGASLALVYPPEMLVVPSPVAIFKGTRNLAAAKKWVDFLLSKDAQAIIAGEGTLPVRSDVALPAQFKLPAPADAVKRAIPVNYIELMAQKEAIVKKFTDIMQGKK